MLCYVYTLESDAKKAMENLNSVMCTTLYFMVAIQQVAQLKAKLTEERAVGSLLVLSVDVDKIL